METVDDSQRKLSESIGKCKVCVSYTRSSQGMSFENLPLMSILMKRVTTDYPTVIYSLERMTCDEERVVFMLMFNEDHNWVKILNSYESNIEVCKEENQILHRSISHPVMLDFDLSVYFIQGNDCRWSQQELPNTSFIITLLFISLHRCSHPF